MRLLPATAAVPPSLPTQTRADAALDATARAMSADKVGADKIDAIQYSGHGYTYAIGRSAVPGKAWPKSACAAAATA